MIENNPTEGSDSFSTEDLVQHKEKELQTLIKVRDHTREIWEQLKLRIQTFEKYETILADLAGTISQWKEVSCYSTNILEGKEYIKVPLEDTTTQ
ncbi:uncharacterized protein Gasu_21430 [Galdieria sulphuraria]|uniref:Uncharacterized protein n=1 Tax=Galdieria sulphuraria TaxID=130081 RepID=M2Y3C5_GALSU|nr:uncharacterized protein Gasu_21430 [Galdieria sulphuraria]EME30468.1 hypothetical protein Gasu_21430 [Galdieria sulphuraria]|eukprot:XP_005706988.1 hypothetical protein Gasu_21430 [Galdieria sulphuraria]